MDMSYREIFNANVTDNYIETGTGGGGTLSIALQCGFKYHASVEPYEPMYNQCLEKFKNNLDSGVLKLYHGHSEKLLGEMLSGVEGKHTFFLDAHPNMPPERFDIGSQPIVKEINIIKEQPRNDHTIIVDDVNHFHCMGTNFEEVIKLLYSINPKYYIEIIPHIHGVLIARV
jgi:hypothetical protein